MPSNFFLSFAPAIDSPQPCSTFPTITDGRPFGADALFYAFYHFSYTAGQIVKGQCSNFVADTVLKPSCQLASLPDFIPKPALDILNATIATYPELNLLSGNFNPAKLATALIFIATSISNNINPATIQNMITALTVQLIYFSLCNHGNAVEYMVYTSNPNNICTGYGCPVGYLIFPPLGFVYNGNRRVGIYGPNTCSDTLYVFATNSDLTSPNKCPAVSGFTAATSLSSICTTSTVLELVFGTVLDCYCPIGK